MGARRLATNHVRKHRLSDEHLRPRLTHIAFGYGNQRSSERRMADRRRFEAHGVTHAANMSEVIAERAKAPHGQQ